MLCNTVNSVWVRANVSETQYLISWYLAMASHLTAAHPHTGTVFGYPITAHIYIYMYYLSLTNGIYHEHRDSSFG